MFARRSLAAILAFTLLSSALSVGTFSWSAGSAGGFSVPEAAAEGAFAGEDLGLDLYRKVDQGIGKLKDMLAEKRTKGSARKLNARIGKMCASTSGSLVECLDPSKDFTLDELSAIEGGSASTVLSHMAADLSVRTDDVAKISAIARKYATALKAEAGDQAQTLGRMGSMGIFTDGSLDNSSYDLMKDVENIHNVIFSKDVPYGGEINDGAKSVMSFAQVAGFPSSYADSNDAGYFGVNFDPTTYVGSFSGRLTSSGLSDSAECADGTWVNGLDAALAADIERQLASGSNAWTAGTPEDLVMFKPRALMNTAPQPLPKGKAENKTDKFPCTLFFCIRVDFIMYTSFLLGGGKTYSIENILDENYKIVQKFAGSSFIQAQHTNNFFELLLKNLNLPSLVHLGVVVQTLPPPILNLKGGDTPRGEPKTSSDEKEFKEVTAGTFGAYGLRYDKQNQLDDVTTAHCIRNFEGLSTDEATGQGKCDAKPVPKGDYAFVKEAAIRQSYSDSFGSDLKELGGFTQTFTDSILSVLSLSKKFSEVKNGR